MRANPRWARLAFALLTGCGLASEELPEVAERPRPAPAPTAFARSLEQAAHRYANGIECGTQYLLEMADLARDADQHIPELVEAFRTGNGESEAASILRLMQERALLVVPALSELAGDPDPAVRRRGRIALDIAFESANTSPPSCTATYTPVRRGRRTRG